MAAGCGGGADPEDSRVRGDTLTVYLSAPQHGLSASGGAAAAAGARRALTEAGGRVSGRRVRLVTLSSTRPGDSTWDPGTVEANAERAEDDPTAIAYIGELELGASAVSLPVTNAAGLLQVSPADGLTSLTRRPPGRPRAGPERYYPERERSFVRLVPSDLELARALVRRLRRADARRAVLLHTGGIAERELAGIVAAVARRRGREPVDAESVGDDRSALPELVQDVAESDPDAVVLLGVLNPVTAALVDGLSQRLPDVALVGGPWMAAAEPAAAGEPAALTGLVPARDQGAAGRRLLGRLARAADGRAAPEGLHGYESMRLVLDAIRRGGADRRRVVGAALAPRVRASPIGRYAVSRGGDVEGLRVAAAELGRSPR